MNWMQIKRTTIANQYNSEIYRKKPSAKSFAGLAEA